ncbi:MAG: electron transfer flavoprotein subunit beta/FixA family protein [Ignavibacteriae bacterium]|nr:electron transfer flavoprotein subunit beta/FixA family protein [Ignavibacteriota bacterium]
MNILVCISRVPDTATRILVGPDGKTIDTQGIKYVISPYDEYGIEEALRLKEKNGGTVTAVTVGNESSTDILRTALAMCVDKAVHIKADEKKDSFFVAKNLAEYAKEMNPDLIFMGRQSVDYDSLQMPSMVSEFLGLPSVSVVSKLTIVDGKATAERDVEGGKEIVEVSLPCIISCQKGLNEPRYPKLPDIMKAKSKPIEAREAIQTEEKVTVMSMAIPSKQRIGKLLGDGDGDVEELVRLLHEEAKII